MIVESGKQNPPRLCAVDGCGRRYHALGMCNSHYQMSRRPKRAKRARTVTAPPPVIDEVVVERLLEGDRVPFNGHERRLAVRRLVQRGIPKAVVARRLGIDGRQVYRDLEATG